MNKLVEDAIYVLRIIGYVVAIFVVYMIAIVLISKIYMGNTVLSVANINVILNSLIFAFVFHTAGGIVSNILIRFPLGIIFSVVYIKTKDLYSSILIHSSYDMFFAFTFFPLIVVFMEGILGSLISDSAKSILLNILCAIVVFLGGYFYLDTVFTPEVIDVIYKNSGLLREGSQITGSSDIGSVITTLLLLVGVNVFGSSVGVGIRKVISLIFRPKKEMAN